MKHWPRWFYDPMGPGELHRCLDCTCLDAHFPLVLVNHGIQTWASIFTCLGSHIGDLSLIDTCMSPEGLVCVGIRLKSSSNNWTTHEVLLHYKCKQRSMFVQKFFRFGGKGYHRFGCQSVVCMLCFSNCSLCSL